MAYIRKIIKDYLNNQICNFVTGHNSKSIQFMPGSFPQPEGNKVMRIGNFDTRRFVEAIGREAWGFIEYKKPLNEKDMRQYELVG